MNKKSEQTDEDLVQLPLGYSTDDLKAIICALGDDTKTVTSPTTPKPLEKKKPAKAPEKKECEAAPGEAVSAISATAKKEVRAAVNIETNSVVRVIAPEAARELIQKLEERFQKYKERFGTLTWESVSSKLEINHDKLWSLFEMERTGGEPALVDYEKKGDRYYFMDCSIESPLGRRNLVYDKKAEVEFRKWYPDAICNGNAVEMAKAMGISLLLLKHYRKLQKIVKVDRNTYGYLKTDDHARRAGMAVRGYLHHNVMRIDEVKAATCDDKTGFRGALWV